MSIKVAIIGSGNIGTDLMIKIMRTSKILEMSALVGIDAQSDGLARAGKFNIATTHEGVEGLCKLPAYKDIQIIFDATSASAHIHNNNILKKDNKQIIDLTPAAIGPYTVPVVNMEQHLDQPNVNMVTCGGQATIPVVAAVADVARVYYAEIIASISSRSAGPGTRANIDEFTDTTARGIETIGRAQKSKAIIILNPAEPPLIMRDTVFTFSAVADEEKIVASINQMVKQVQQYVPGYRLKQEIQFDRFNNKQPLMIPGLGKFAGLKTSVFIEVEGAAHYLPAYAGNLDIMTSAALATAERIAELKFAKTQAACL